MKVEKDGTEIEALARMVANGFSSLEKNMNERFDGVEGRLDGLESRMEKVEVVLTEAVHRIDETNSRMDSLVMPVLEDHSRRIKDLELAAA